MDAFYIFRHSRHNDQEFRYSLRSLARHLSWIRKVWVFGDRPEWLSRDTLIVEHVPHETVAWIPGFKTPVVNQFAMMYLSALLPGVAEEYLWFCDDYILLNDLDCETAIRKRSVEDLSTVKNRGRGLFKDALWRTYDVLKRFDFEGINYEVHVPVHLRKVWVLNAVKDFRDFMSEDRYFGLLAQTAVLNHARRQEQFSWSLLREEGSYAGFHHKGPDTDAIEKKCSARTFLNFDDDAFNKNMQRFLEKRFPEPCMYEAGRAAPVRVPELPALANESTDLGESTPPPQPAIPQGAESVDHSPQRCVVLVPCQGAIVPQCEQALRELEERGYAVRRVQGYSAIDQARNQMATDAMADGFDETMWIDADIGFHPDDVAKLRKHGLPLTCGIYPKKGRRALAIQTLSGTPNLMFGQSGGVSELLYGGAGFLHVRREVYLNIQAQLKLPSCNEHANRPMIPYFQPLVRTWQGGTWYLAEGFAFCHRARACGYSVWADTTIRLWHVGAYAYSWEEAGIERQRFATFKYVFPSSDGVVS